MISLEEIINTITASVNPDSVIGEAPNCTPGGLFIKREDIKEVCNTLHKNEKLYFDFLSSITGVDNGPEDGTMEVIYNLYSIPNNTSIMLKASLDRSNPVIDSVINIWKGADWQERETYDLFGIDFEGHPDLRRILLPSDWEGYPMRKDYEEQTYYHGITVKYED